MSREDLNAFLPERFQRWSGGMAVQDTPLARAKRHAEAADDANRRLGQLIDTHLAGLFGDWVHGTFGRVLENASEHHGETVWNYAEALAERTREALKARDSLNHTNLALAQCAERIQAHQAKAHVDLPDDLAQIVIIAAVQTGWDYLFPPDDQRHVHDLDGGGNCRNPACRRSVATIDDEPF